MRFKSEKASRQLVEKGIVATMRNYKLRPRTVVKAKTTLGEVYAVVEDVYPNYDEIVGELFYFSGFETPEEWIREALRLHNGRKPKYIILLRLLK